MLSRVILTKKKKNFTSKFFKALKSVENQKCGDNKIVKLVDNNQLIDIAGFFKYGK